MPPSSSKSRKQRLIALGAFLLFSAAAFVLVQNEVKEPYMVRPSRELSVHLLVEG